MGRHQKKRQRRLVPALTAGMAAMLIVALIAILAGGHGTASHGPAAPRHHATVQLAPPALPGPGTPATHHAPATHAVITVTVKAGDTLWGIASRYLHNGSDWHAIYSANHRVVGSNPNLIFPGQHLRITI